MERAVAACPLALAPEARLEARRLSVRPRRGLANFSGISLRPGFGVVGDELRMDALWRLHEAGPCFQGRRIRTQEYILFGVAWRVGSTRERQTNLLDREFDKIRSGDAPAELVRLVGFLELIPYETKAELVSNFINMNSDACSCQTGLRSLSCSTRAPAQPSSVPRRAGNCRLA